MLLSPALAAALYAALPLHWIILTDTLGALFAIGGLLFARLPVLRVGQPEQRLRIWRDTKEGFAVLRSHRWLWELCLICALFSVAFMPVSALFPLMSMQYFGGDTASAAVVETAFSIGMLAGSVILGLWGGFRDKMATMLSSIFALGRRSGGHRPAASHRLLDLCRPLPVHGADLPLLQFGLYGSDPRKGRAGISGAGARPVRGHHDAGIPRWTGRHRSAGRPHRHHRLVSAVWRRHPFLRRAGSGSAAVRNCDKLKS